MLKAQCLRKVCKEAIKRAKANGLINDQLLDCINVQLVVINDLWVNLGKIG